MPIDELKLRRKNILMAVGIILVILCIFSAFINIWGSLIMLIAGLAIQYHARRIEYRYEEDNDALCSTT